MRARSGGVWHDLGETASVSAACGPGGCDPALRRLAAAAAADRRRLARTVQDRARLDGLERGMRPASCRCGQSCRCDERRLHRARGELAISERRDRQREDLRRLEALRSTL
ncbi:MAG: hypothetical protein OXG35_20065 [Acidobacteria bacterium]|nr:hypothetical protein [Acidobacteriota bacterium]